MASASNFLSRKEFIAQKKIEEARKQGKLPPAKDEEGHEINPHMPMYITQAPWYLNQQQPSLRHQRARNKGDKVEISKWFKRGLETFTGEKITKYRKGACENCGAMTHKARECLERPRAKGAKWSGKNFGRDELQDQINMSKDFDAKRDRWNGFNPEEYTRVIKDWEEANDAELEKKQIEEQDQESEVEEGVVKNQEYYAKKDPKIVSKTLTQRNRNDTIKYMENLAAFNDDKPLPLSEYQAQIVASLGGASGQQLEFQEQEEFIEKAESKAKVTLNSISNPSQAELMYKSFKEKKNKIMETKKKELIAEYGGAQHLRSTQEIAELVPLQNQEAQLIGAKHFPVSKEKVEPAIEKHVPTTKKKKKTVQQLDKGGHTQVWGSYWHEAYGWGYACCLGFKRYATCGGEHGKKVTILKEVEYDLKKQQMIERGEFDPNQPDYEKVRRALQLKE